MSEWKFFKSAKFVSFLHVKCENTCAGYCCSYTCIVCKTPLPEHLKLQLELLRERR